jgi:hypothetical protein
MSKTAAQFLAKFMDGLQSKQETVKARDRDEAREIIRQKYNLKPGDRITVIHQSWVKDDDDLQEEEKKAPLAELKDHLGRMDKYFNKNEGQVQKRYKVTYHVEPYKRDILDKIVFLNSPAQARDWIKFKYKATVHSVEEITDEQMANEIEGIDELRDTKHRILELLETIRRQNIPIVDRKILRKLKDYGFSARGQYFSEEATQEDLKRYR